MASRYPFDSMEQLFDQMRRGMFDGMAAENRWDSGVSVERHDDALVVLADLPGFDRADLSVTLRDDRLLIEGVSEADDGIHSRSRSVRETVRLPNGIDAEAAEASYHNGVLEVHFPLAGEAENGVSIDIE